LLSFICGPIYAIRNDLKEGFGIQTVEVDAAATNAIIPEGQN
jgi:hypothetical protein